MMKKEKGLWNKRYELGGNSGRGSYGRFLGPKIDPIRNLKGVKTILDVGCGDLNVAQSLMESFPEAKYLGIDVSDYIIEKNRQIQPDWDFEVLKSPKFKKPADLVLCLDVLYHVLGEDDYLNMLKSLKNSWQKYLVIQTTDTSSAKGAKHIKHRKFDVSFFRTQKLKQKVKTASLADLYLFEL